ncbi:MAG: CBS domain-containing protein, partial [Chloroflexota bacterium]
VMTPVGQLIALEAGENVGDALLAMGRRAVSVAPVVQAGRPVGILSQATALDFLRLRQQTDRLR